MPAGGTAIEPALATALAQKTPKYQPHQVIFVTDGRPTVGMTNPTSIIESAQAKLRPQDRLFTFGVGYEVHTILLDGLARAGRGRSDYVKPGQNLETAVAALYTRISSPVLSDVSIDFGKTRVYDVYPNPIGDLFRGDQIVLFGRNRTAFQDRVVVNGRVGQEKKSFEFGGGKSETKAVKLDNSSETPLEFLPKLWATRKVGFLLEQIRVNGEQAELKNEVIRLAKKFGLVTPYTSYLAVDDSELEPRRPQSRVDVDERPQDMPRGEDRLLSGPEESAPQPSSVPRQKSKGNVLKKVFGGFGDSSGEGAVAASEATRDYRETEKVAEDSGISHRFVSDRTFVWGGKQWVEDGLSAKQVNKAKVIEAYSNAYFELLRKHPELKRIASKLGDKFVVKIGSTIYRVKPK